MENQLNNLFENNKKWSESIHIRDPEFFSKLSRQQAPEHLWIGCADSRVPANEIVGLMPGELFVHRNIANLIVHSDLNCLSVLQFAVEVLKVKHIIVCGHYGCSGVHEALASNRLGLSDNWLRHVHDVRNKHETLLTSLDDVLLTFDRLCELNVIEQAVNACQTTVVQEAWQRGQELTVHSWIYGLKDGLLHDLHMSVSSSELLAERYRAALASVKSELLRN
jgi:carbonic anhydrase